MNVRCNILPEPRFAELGATLQERLAQVAAAITAENFPSLLDPLMRTVLQEGFDCATAHEGTVWLADAAGEFLSPAFNSGPNAGRWVGKFKQPLSSGIISMVFASEQPFIENEVFKNALQSKVLDHNLGVQTHALIAVPFYFLKACRGVISCVQLNHPGAAPDSLSGFRPEHLLCVEQTAALLSRLVEYRLLSNTVGWTTE